MASLLTADVAQLLTNSSMRPIVRKKAALALLRLLRKSSDNAEDILPADVSGIMSGVKSCAMRIDGVGLRKEGSARAAAAAAARASHQRRGHPAS